MNALVEGLKNLALVEHDKVLFSDREGYPVEVSVCKRWKTLEWKDRDGSHCEEYYGRYDPEEPCTCGADEINKMIEELALAIDSRIK